MKKIKYKDLNSKQKEIYNFQKIASRMAEYGFNCIKLADDWQGADFLAYHNDGVTTMRVQLKGRITIAKKYIGKNLHIAFPLYDKWYVIDHDELVALVETYSNWTETESWVTHGAYSAATPNKDLFAAIEKFELS